MKVLKKFLIITFPYLLSVPIYSEDVKVGIFIVNIGKFEVGTGNFTVDFYLTLKTEKIPEFPLNSFEFMNGRATSMEKIYDEPNLQQYRIQANLASPINLTHFPFDEQVLSIIIENKKFTNDKVRYVPVNQESGLDDSIHFTGWNIKDWKTVESEHFYKVFNENYSLYAFNITIEKIIWNAFLKTFLPVLIIVFLITCSFIMDIDKIKDRLSICTSGLVASVMFHLSISNQIPPVSYLTIADKFMIQTYLVLMSCIILNVFMLQMTQIKNEALNVKIHNFTKFGMFFVMPLVYALFFTFTMN
ncbi:MAG: hypothetical protein SFU98_09040 [Leptospiraceae bacterium]|nr:hypothetical protein [Leptospiraceae bacterium]